MQWNGLRFGDAASETGPKNLPREMQGVRGQGQDRGRQLRRRLFAIRWGAHVRARRPGEVSNVSLAYPDSVSIPLDQTALG
jgi:hypothetical protein